MHVLIHKWNTIQPPIHVHKKLKNKNKKIHIHLKKTKKLGQFHTVVIQIIQTIVKP